MDHDQAVVEPEALPGATTEPQHAPATGTAAWGMLFAVGIAITIGQVSTTLVLAPLSLYLRSLGVPAGRIGLEVGAASVLATVATLGVGPLINRWGPKSLLLAGMGAYLLAAVGLLAVPSELAATCFRALQGVGMGLILPSSLTLVPRLVPRRPGTAIGAVGSLYTVATAAGPPLGLLLYAHGGRVGLFAPAAACATLGIGLCALLPRTERPATRRGGFGFERRWTPELLANALCNAYFGGIAAYLPLVLAHPGAPNAGIFFTADALGALLLRAPTGMLVDRSGPRLAEIVGVVMTLAGISALFLPASTLTLILAGAGTGTGVGLFLSAVLVSLTQRSDEHNRGTAMALGSASFNVGIFAGSALSGMLVGPGGFTAVLVLGLITTLAGLPLVLFERPAKVA